MAIDNVGMGSESAGDEIVQHGCDKRPSSKPTPVNSRIGCRRRRGRSAQGAFGLSNRIGHPEENISRTLHNRNEIRISDRVTIRMPCREDSSSSTGNFQCAAHADSTFDEGSPRPIGVAPALKSVMSVRTLFCSSLGGSRQTSRPFARPAAPDVPTLERHLWKAQTPGVLWSYGPSGTADAGGGSYRKLTRRLLSKSDSRRASVLKSFGAKESAQLRCRRIATSPVSISPKNRIGGGARFTRGEFSGGV